MKMKMKIKTISHRYDVNRPRKRHGHRYSKYKRCLCMMMLICIKQHVSNVWSSIQEKVKQHWDWVEKSVDKEKSNVTNIILTRNKFDSLFDQITWNVDVDGHRN